MLVSALGRMSGTEGAGFEESAAEIEAEVGFAADDSEFTVFNTDRRLEALKTLTEAMAGIEQKKSLIYFSSGMTQTGLVFQLEVPTAELKPGLYTCQVNVIDDVGGTFAFPRLTLWIRQ